MAKLPGVTDLRPIPNPTRALATVDQDAISGLGLAVRGLGREAETVGNEIQDREDTAAAKERDTLVSEKIRNLLYDPEGGFMNMEGGTAVQSRKAISEQIRQLRNTGTEGLTNGAQRKLSDRLDRRIENALQSIDTHTSGARRDWINGATAASVDGAIQDSLYDMTATERSLEVIRTEYRGMAAREGWSPEKLEMELEKAQSSVFTGQIQRIANRDPVGALEYLRDNQDKMRPSDVAALEIKLGPEIKQAIGRAKGREVFEGPVLPGFQNMQKDVAGKIRQLPLADSYMKNMSAVVRALGDGYDIKVVSAGQHQKGDGPRTGSDRHDVDDHGVGHTADLVLVKNGQEIRPGDDPELYERLFELAAPLFPGMGHYEWGVHIGGGDQAFWGPDTTSVSADSRFVMAVVRGRERGAQIGSPVRQIADIEDPVERDAALAEFEFRQAIEIGEQKAALEAATNQAFEYIEGGGGVDDIPLEVRDALGMKAMASLRSYAKSKASRTPIETDPETYVRLRQIQASDPQAFQALNMVEYVDRLSETDFKKLVDDQTKPPSEISSSAASTLMATAGRQIAAAGIDTTPKKGSTDSSKVSAVQSQLLKWQDKYVVDNGRAPSQLEIDEQTARLLVPFLIDPPGLFNKASGNLFEAATLDLDADGLVKSSVTIDGLEIPAGVVNEQIEVLRAQGVEPTPDEVLMQVILQLEEAGLR